MKALSNPLMYIAMGVLLCFLVMVRCEGNKKNGVSTTKVVTKIDTVLVPKIDTITITKTKFIPEKIIVIRRDTVRINIDTALAERHYRGTIKKSLVKADYFIKTTGTLDSINLDIINHTPTTVVTKETTITKQSKAIYVGLGLNGSMQPSANINYVDGRQMIGVDYKPSSLLQSPTNFTIRYSRKISLR